MHFGRTLRSGEGSGGKNRIKADVKRAGTRTPRYTPQRMLQSQSQGGDRGPPLQPSGDTGGDMGRGSGVMGTGHSPIGHLRDDVVPVLVV